MAAKSYIITAEDYQDAEVKALTGGQVPLKTLSSVSMIFAALRFKEMGEAGIDRQVLSHSIPGLPAIDAGAGSRWLAAKMIGYTRRC